MLRIIPILAAIAFMGGCVTGLPADSSIPRDAPPEVRKNIKMLYRGARSRGQGCYNLYMLACQGADSSAAVPWLIVLLKDDSYTWNFSAWNLLDGKWPWVRSLPVSWRAQQSLVVIGDPAIPDLKRTVDSSPVAKQRERAKDVLASIQARRQTTKPTTGPSP